MNWYHRGEERYVEYGSSFQATRAFGILRSLTDTIYNMNIAHLSRARADGVRARSTTPTCAPRARPSSSTAAATATSPRARRATRGSPSRTLFRHAVWGPRELFYADLFASRRHRLPSPARHARPARPAHRLRGRLPGRARPVRLPALLAARQRHPLAQDRPGRPGRLDRRAPTASCSALMRRRRRPRRVPRRARGDRDGRPLAGARSRTRDLAGRRPSPTCDGAASPYDPSPDGGRDRASARRQRSAMVYALDRERRDELLAGAVGARAGDRRASTWCCAATERRGGRSQRARRAALRARRRPRATSRGRHWRVERRARRARARASRTACCERRLPGRAARRLGGADVPDTPATCCSPPRPATSSSTGAAPTTSAAAATARCTATTRRACCCRAAPDPRPARGARAVVAARRRADGARPLRL